MSTPVEALRPDVYRQLVENSTDMLSRHAPDGTYLYASPACRDLLGYAPDELVGRSAYDLFHPEDLARIGESHRAVLDGPALSTVAYRIRHADGHYVWFETTSHTIRDLDTGAVVEIQTSSRDITARVRAQALLRESEHRFRLAMENAPIGMALVGLDGAFLSVNDSLCELLGRSAETLRSLTFQDITHPEDLDLDLRFAEQLLAGDINHYRMEKRYLLPDGGVVWALLGGSLVRDEESRPLYFIAQIVDISERKQAELELSRLNAELERFAAVAAHDLRSPLATVRGFLELLLARKGDGLDEEGRRMVDVAARVAAQMAESVEGLLSLARVGADELSWEVVHLEDVVAEAADMVATELADAGADLRVSPLPEVEGDRTQLRLLFQNLLANAIKFRAVDRPLVIEVSAELSGSSTSVTIRDNGRGFDPADRDAIFDPFARTREGHNVGAVGLGLATCRRIVERHGGTIEAYAEEPGARFVFTVPVVAAVVAHPGEAPS